MDRVEVTVRIDARLVDKLQAMKVDLSDFLERAGKKQIEMMQGGPLRDDPNVG